MKQPVSHIHTYIKMHTPAFVCAALLGLAHHVVSRPLEKRAPRGPKMGGENFPSMRWNHAVTVWTNVNDQLSDPAIIGANNRWYAFATRNMGGNIHIQVAESADFENWNLVKNADGSQKDALPNLPSWVDGGNSNTVSTIARSIVSWPSLQQLTNNIYSGLPMSSDWTTVVT